MSWLPWRRNVGDDELDSKICSNDFERDEITDDDADGIVLFADLAGTTSLDAIEERRREWQELFG